MKDQPDFPIRPAEHRPEDELANLVTHGFGFLLSLPASVVLMALVLNRSTPRAAMSFGVYCFTLTGLYAASMLSHLFHDLAWRRVFRTVDQAFIYLLIVGSFTPVAVTFLGHGWWPLLLGVMWVLAAVGVAFVLRVRNLSPTAQLSYGVVGWLPVVAMRALFEAAPPDILAWLVASGLFYTVGTLFLRYDRHVRYLHALWHTFVIAGSTCHYIALLLVAVRL